jgi:hypothetical protein
MDALLVWVYGPGVNRRQLIGGDVWQGSYCQGQRSSVRPDAVPLHVHLLGNGRGKVCCRTLLEGALGAVWLASKLPMSSDPPVPG